MDKGGEIIPMVKSSFNDAVKETLKILNINQTELAEKTGYSVSYISNLLNGNKRWNEQAITKVCDVLGIQTTYEFKGEEVNAN